MIPAAGLDFEAASNAQPEPDGDLEELYSLSPFEVDFRKRGPSVHEFPFNSPGRIVMYKSGRCVAFCGNRAHGKLCRISRECFEISDFGSFVGKRRVLGLMAWYLLHDDQPSATEHQAAARKSSQQERHESRSVLYMTPRVETLLSFERPVGDGSDEEPLDP